MNSIRVSTRTLLTVLVMLTIVGCKKAALPAAQSAAGSLAAVDLATLPGTIFNVTYNDHTVMVDEATVRKTLRSVSTNGNVLVFDPSPQIQKLGLGSVLFMQGLAVRKVLATMPFESGTALLTVPAAITDYIQEGQIHWDYPVRFSATSASRDPVGSPLQAEAGLCLANLLKCLESHASPVVYAADAPPGSHHGQLKGWDYWASGTNQDNRVQVRLEVKRVEAGIHALLTGDGYLQNFDTSSDIEIHDGKLQDFRWSNKNLNGVMNFGWEVGKEKKGVWAEEDKIPLPTSFKIPLLIGAWPLTISVDEALLIHPAMTEGNQLSEAHFRVEYNGYSRFSVHSGNINDDGQVSGNTSLVNMRALSPVAGHAFVAALAGPRMGIKLGVSSAWDKLKETVHADQAERALQFFLSLDPVKKLLDSNTPGGRLYRKALGILPDIKEAVEMALKSDAAAHLEIIIAAKLLDSGPMVVVPCQQAQAVVTVQAGANAELLGQTIAQADKILGKYQKTWGSTSGACATE